MQGSSRQSLELREAVEEVAVRVSGMAGDVVQLLHVSRTYAEREHGRARVLQQVGRGSWIAAVAEAVSYQEHHFARRFATLLEDRLANDRNVQLNVIDRASIGFLLPPQLRDKR